MLIEMKANTFRKPEEIGQEKVNESKEKKTIECIISIRNYTHKSIIQIFKFISYEQFLSTQLRNLILNSTHKISSIVKL